MSLSEVNESNIKKRIALMAAISPMIFCLTLYFLDLLVAKFNMGLVPERSSNIYIIVGLIGLVIGAALTIINYKVGPVANWNIYKKLALNPTLKWLILAFTLTPILLKSIQALDLDLDLPFAFYRFWFLGFWFYLYILAFDILCPEVFKYKDFTDFTKKENSLVTFRKDALTIYTDLSNRKNKNKLIPFEKANLEEDLSLLKGIADGYTSKDMATAFSTLKFRSSTNFDNKRSTLIFFLIPVLTILITIFAGNLKLATKSAIESTCNEIRNNIEDPDLSSLCNPEEIENE